MKRTPREPRFEARIETRDGQARAALYLYDMIGWPFIEAQAVVEELERFKDAGARALDVYINSPGGDVFDGVAIHAALSRWEGEKIVTVDGLCASVASVIAMAGDRVVATVGAMFMVHNPWSFVGGEAADLRRVADRLDAIQGVIAGIYAEATGRELDEIKQLMDAETWMVASEAIALGFADELAKDQGAELPPADLLRPASLGPMFEKRLPDAARAIWNRARLTHIRKEEKTMNEHMQKIAAQLGLAANAEPDEVVSATTRAVEHTVVLASIYSLLGLEVGAEPKRAELAILDLQKPGNMVPRTEHDQVVGELAGLRVELSVQRAIQAGVISATKEDQDHWRKRARVDLQDCDRLIASGERRVVPMTEQAPRDVKTAKTNASGLTPIEEKVCKQLGLTAEQFKAAPMPRETSRDDED